MLYNKIKEKIPEYIKLLSEDFNKNQEYADAFSRIFLDGYSIEKLITKDKLIIDFFNWNLNKPLPYNSTAICINNASSLEFNYKILNNVNQNDLYTFFSKKEFESLEMANQSNLNSYFYVFEKDFSKKMDLFILGNLIDYKKVKNIYIKNISTNFSLVFNTRKEYKKLEVIESYTYPTFQILDENNTINLFGHTDLSKLLFMPATIFTHFYAYYNLFSYTEKMQIVKVESLKNEPIIIFNKNSNTYEISNSSGTLMKLNKFIFLTTELFIHYFNLFEAWLISAIGHY